MYQIERDWKKAIIAATELEKLQNKSHRTEIAQFYCELAQESLRRKDMSSAQQAIQNALQAVPNHARSLILQGDYLVAMDRPSQAIEVWALVAQNNPAYMHLVADRWMAAHHALEKADFGLDQLIELLKTQASGELLDITHKHITQLRGAQAAEAMLVEVMQHSASLMALAKLAETRLTLAELSGPASRVSDLQSTLGLLKQRTTALARYTVAIVDLERGAFIGNVQAVIIGRHTPHAEARVQFQAAHRCKCLKGKRSSIESNNYWQRLRWLGYGRLFSGIR
jgi:lipopolysaccharide biosynthesis regulator YciM